VLAGRYRLLSALGTGGMGTVWRARDELLDREVAVKEVLLPPGYDEEMRAAARRRTFREAQAAARLRHPAIVAVYDVVEHDDRPWIVMELVESRSLAQVVREDGPLPPARVAAIALRVLDAMVTAEAAGVRHRDIKPANVLITADHRVVLTDFGIARQTGDETLTNTGLLVGSPDFLAPERARGQDSPGLEADLWSLGALIYDAVEGRRPFARNGPIATLAAVVMDEPEPMLRAGGLRPVIDGLLVKDPAGRLDADRTRAMLQRVIRGLPPTARTTAEPASDADTVAATVVAPVTKAGPPPGKPPATTTPATKTPATKTPATKTPTTKTPAGKTPAGAAAAAAAAAGTAAAGKAPVEETPAGTTTVGRTPPAARPERPAKDPGRRRVLVGALAGLALLAAAVGIPLALSDDGDDPGTPPAAAPSTSRPAATEPATTPPPTATAAPTTTAAATTTPARTTPAATTSAPTGGTPAGFTRYTDPALGFSLLVPAGWQPSRGSGAIDFEDPRTARYLRIAYTSTPQDDPLENWITYEQQFSAGKRDYQNLGIRRVPYGADRGWTAADWEFRLGGTHVLNRNIRVSNSRAHAIYWSTPESLWSSAESRRILAQAQASFSP
jgi:eukaryotic-like serine/threonine-protein kinase